MVQWWVGHTTYIHKYAYMYFVQWFLSKNIAFQKIKEDLKKEATTWAQRNCNWWRFKLSKEVAKPPKKRPAWELTKYQEYNKGYLNLIKFWILRLQLQELFARTVEKQYKKVILSKDVNTVPEAVPVWPPVRYISDTGQY